MLAKTTHWLALDLASNRTSWAIARIENDMPVELFEEAIGSGHNHSEVMIESLVDLLEKSHLSMSAMEKLLVANGPGSYTGLRIAYAALKAIAMSKRLPIIAIPSHEARVLAYAEKVSWELPYDHIYCVSNHAMNRYVSAHYRLRDANRMDFVNDKVITGLNDFEDAESALILTEDSDMEYLMPKEDGVDVKTFPLQASYLLTAYKNSRLKKESADISEVIDLTPTYYGESFKPIM